MEKWESESLAWIHKIREQSYKETKGTDLWVVAQRTNRNAQEFIKSLGLTPKSRKLHS